jgi:hypothetical protein
VPFGFALIGNTPAPRDSASSQERQLAQGTDTSWIPIRLRHYWFVDYAQAAGLVDGLSIGFDLVIVSFLYLLQDSEIGIVVAFFYGFFMASL